MKVKLLLLFLSIIFFAVAWTNHLALEYYLYFELPWLDIPMHFLGGFWLGLGALWVYYLSGLFKNIPENHRSKLYVMILALTSALVLGGVWEVYEFGMDFIADKTDQYDIFDTLSDFFFDMVGGIVSTILFIAGDNYKKE